MYYLPRASWTKHLDFMVVDLVCLNISFLLAYALRFQTKISTPYVSFLVVVNFLEIIVTLATNNLHEVLKRGLFTEFICCTVLSIGTMMLSTLYMFIVHNSGAFSRLLLLLTYIFFIVLLLAARSMMKKIVCSLLKKKASKKNAGRSVFVVTETALADEIINDIRADFYNNFRIQGITILDENELHKNYDGISSVGSLEDAAKHICREWIDEVFLYVTSFDPRIFEFRDKCKKMGIVLHTIVARRDAERNKQFVEEIGNLSMLTTAYSFIAPQQALFKRCLDILGGLVGSVIAVLIGIFVGPMIYFKSPGPIIFKQKRIGKNGKQFWVYKFRSMYLDAEDRKQSLMTENRVSDGMMFKLDFDPRIIGNRILPDGTKKRGLGEFIRKTSLDEFPQFFNVLKGEMSLVGTRPPTVDEWEKYEYHHRARLSVKPGITGLWQVSGRSEITDFEEVVKLDTEYITHYKPSLDIKILFKTVVVLLQRKGAM